MVVVSGALQQLLLLEVIACRIFPFATRLLRGGCLSLSAYAVIILVAVFIAVGGTSVPLSAMEGWKINLGARITLALGLLPSLAYTWYELSYLEAIISS